MENVSFKTDIIMLGKLLQLTFNMMIRANHAKGFSYYIGYDDEGYAISLRQEKKLIKWS